MLFLEKRTAEKVHFDIDCSQILAANEVIQAILDVVSDTQLPALTLEAAVFNTLPIKYKERTVPAGKVVQVLIGGGGLNANQALQDYVVRAHVRTNLNPIVEATVRLRIVDTP